MGLASVWKGAFRSLRVAPDPGVQSGLKIRSELTYKTPLECIQYPDTLRTLSGDRKSVVQSLPAVFASGTVFQVGAKQGICGFHEGSEGGFYHVS